MALKSETASPPDGMAINQESGGDDLEDGEIFDEEEETSTSLPNPPPPPSIGALSEDKKQIVSRQKVLQQRQRKQKRIREDDNRLFRNNKQRRRSEEGAEKAKDKSLTEEEDMREMSPLRGDWDRVHQRTSGFEDLLDDDDDEIEGGRRGGRGFNRRRGGRNGRGGGKRMNRREGGQICKFYLQGKCQRGNECPYSHASYQRKYELCKFYMMECCAKKERCPFLHSEFPCKYYNLGMKCFAGKKCKLSHGKITQQFRANLLRDSKECDFLIGLDLSPPGGKEELDGSGRRGGDRRERRRDHREKDHREKDHRGKRAKERKGSKEDEDRYTLHFKVDPRTVSDEEDGQKTPMPSPSQDNSSDREVHSSPPPPPEIKTEILSPKPEIQLPDPKDNGIGEELPEYIIPADLPKHQRELYKRIQQQQREASSLQDGDELEGAGDEKEGGEDFKDEYWYSSEEEESVKKMEPITMLLNKLKQPLARNPSPPTPQPPPAPVMVPSVMLPDIDISAVTKLLSTVRETIQQKQNSDKRKAAEAAAAAEASIPALNLDPLPPLNALISDSQQPPEKRRRDPRLRGSDDDIDLRRQDVDLRQLPFKPAPIQPPANEIDASIAAHPPLTFHLIPISPPPPPDYSNLQLKNVNDPRLRRYMSGGVMTPVSVSLLMPTAAVTLPTAAVTLPTIRPPPGSRDPRQARILPNDPRRKRDADFRQTFNHVNDIDLRLQPSNLAFK